MFATNEKSEYMEVDIIVGESENRRKAPKESTYNVGISNNITLLSVPYYDSFRKVKTRSGETYQNCAEEKESFLIFFSSFFVCTHYYVWENWRSSGERK